MVSFGQGIVQFWSPLLLAVQRPEGNRFKRRLNKVVEGGWAGGLRKSLKS